MVLNSDGFVGLLRARATDDPGGVYARFNGKPVTFSALDSQASSFAHELRARGIKRGERVAVMMRNGIEAIAVIFGLAKAGVAWIPVNVQQRGQGLAYLLSHPEPRLIVVDHDLVAVVKEALPGANRAPLLVHGPAGGLTGMLSAAHIFDEAAGGADDVFAIMYTSGTTGRPKGVIVTHRMIRLATDAVCLVAAVNPGDVFFVWEPLYHIGGAQLLPLPLLRDVVLAMVDRFSASRFWDQVRHENATHIHYLGGILQILLKQPPNKDDRQHRVRIAWGGGCPAETWRQFHDRFGVEVRECYGMTEASSITTFNDEGLVGAVGRPLPWFTVALMDPAGRPAAAGERGEIVVRADRPGALFSGYLNDPEATARALRDGALYTGDSGSFDASGNLIFHGRISDSVRCRGENVSAWEVEHVAAEYEAVEDCAMIGVESDVGEQDIKLFVKPKAGHAIDPAAFSLWLRDRLAPYQNPRYIAVIDEFERTASHRIMKHKLSKRRDDCFDRAALVDR
ncbi:MAG: AMP-binding protein [Pseudolabrys sp.]|jgi:crotonobetaine/carnitine-CoA ligase